MQIQGQLRVKNSTLPQSVDESIIGLNGRGLKVKKENYLKFNYFYVKI